LTVSIIGNYLILLVILPVITSNGKW